ncbi:hypothetical protein M2145_000965 [Lachnospiraceae bacterium PF1-21]|uniref:DUF6179 domain-containing protein n=1 Tax=Ohessyouella blattaphilus TaxID=2949333 RepID=UPI003E1ECA18
MTDNKEELLRLLNQVIQKSVSYESTSVTYERAQELMDGILYHVEVCGAEEGSLRGENTPLEVLYQQGLEITKKKVYRAKAVYTKIIEDFRDYGVENYRETILKGMPAFFLNYDPIYLPQNHILTLDYPPLHQVVDKRGADLILEYLEDIRAEQHFLNRFSENAIIQVLEEVSSDYRQDYLDNIVYCILRQVLFCMIAGKSIERLEVDAEDKEEIVAFFARDAKEKAIAKIKRLIGMLEERLSLREGYFQSYALEFYTRL